MWPSLTNITSEYLKNFPKFDHFLGKNLLGIDYGTKVIGLASFCPGQSPYVMAHGRIIVSSRQQSLLELSNIIRDEFIDTLVFGAPLYNDGKPSKICAEISIFVEELKKNLPHHEELNFYQQDETLTSYEAKKRMEQSPEYNFKVDYKKIDTLSAIIILEDFLKSPQYFAI